jgi:valyl-tRNA synthetase
MKVGRRLATKLLNASRFVLGLGVPMPGAAAAEPLDRALLAELATVVEKATAALEDLDYARALQVTETFFWTFCDDYVELVKGRAYGDRGPDAAQSARAALVTALSALLRLFAPFLPFATEEVWSWWRPGSVHRAAWPVPETGDGKRELLPLASQVIAAVRRAKTDAKVSMRSAVDALTVTGPAEVLARFALIEPDIRSAGAIVDITTGEGDFAVEAKVDSPA